VCAATVIQALKEHPDALEIHNNLNTDLTEKNFEPSMRVEEKYMNIDRMRNCSNGIPGPLGRFGLARIAARVLHRYNSRHARKTLGVDKEWSKR